MTHEGGPADLVLTGGHVHTVDEGRARAEAVAVRGEHIVAVGTASEVPSPLKRPPPRPLPPLPTMPSPPRAWLWASVLSLTVIV